MTDEAVMLQHRYGNGITSVHNEACVDNDPSNGYRARAARIPPADQAVPARVDRRGRVGAQVEGALARMRSAMGSKGP
jgi:hypothetical protein